MRSMKFSASLVRTPRRSYSNGPIRLTHGSSSLPLPAQIPVLYGPGFEPGRPGEKGHVRIWHLPVSDIGKNPLPVLTKSVEHRDGKRGLPDSPIFVDVRTWKTPLPGPGRGVFQAPSRTWKFRRMAPDRNGTARRTRKPPALSYPKIAISALSIFQIKISFGIHL